MSSVSILVVFTCEEEFNKRYGMMECDKNTIFGHIVISIVVNQYERNTSAKLYQLAVECNGRDVFDLDFESPIESLFDVEKQLEFCVSKDESGVGKRLNKMLSFIKDKELYDEIRDLLPTHLMKITIPPESSEKEVEYVLRYTRDLSRRSNTALEICDERK